MKLEIIAFTPRGAVLAGRLGEGLAKEGHSCRARSFRAFPEAPEVPPLAEPLSRWAQEAFARADGIIFVAACGIAVRTIAPFVRDKTRDPAVVAVDEGGNFAVSLLSGHAGGANLLARQAAAVCGGRAVITTATDVEGLFALDDWAARRGWRLEDPRRVKAVSAALLEGKTVTFRSDFPVAGQPPRGLVQVERGGDRWFTLSAGPGDGALKVFPPALTVGIGCRKGASRQQVERCVLDALERGGLSPLAVAGAATIDRKGEEPGLLEFCRERGWPLALFSPEELEEAPGSFSASPFVREVTGVDNVCERSAVLAAGGPLLIPKTALDGVTAAAASREVVLDLTLPGEKKGE